MNPNLEQMRVFAQCWIELSLQAGKLKAESIVHREQLDDLIPEELSRNAMLFTVLHDGLSYCVYLDQGRTSFKVLDLVVNRGER